MNLVKFLKDLHAKGAIVNLDGEKLKIEAIPGILNLTEIEQLKEHKSDIIELFYKFGIESSCDFEYLSYSQNTLWLIEKIEPAPGRYNISTKLSVNGNIDIFVLKRCIKECIDRHQILRTVYLQDADGYPVQVVRTTTEIEFIHHDLNEISGDTRLKRIDEIFSLENSNPFDLSNDLMLRATYITLDNSSGILVLTMHHIACDGWSSEILSRELAALYSAFGSGNRSPFPELRLQYMDYASWQNNILKGDKFDNLLNFWRVELEGIPDVHNLPTDRPRKVFPSYCGSVFTQTISGDTLSEIRNFAKENKVTLFMLLHAIFSILISRYSGEKDIVIGSPIANRENKDVSNLIGFFVNTLVLRLEVQAASTVRDLLEKSKEKLLNAYDHQDLPFEKLVEELQVLRSSSYTPIFQIMLSVQEKNSLNLDLGDIKLEPILANSEVAKFELLLDVLESENELEINWSYSTDLFDKSTIVRMANHLDGILSQIQSIVDDTISSIDLLTNKEKYLAIYEWNSSEPASVAGKLFT